MSKRKTFSRQKQNLRIFRFVLAAIILTIMLVSTSSTFFISGVSDQPSTSITPIIRNSSEPLGVGWTLGTAYGDYIWQGNPQDTWTKLNIYSTMAQDGFNWFRIPVTLLSYPELENMTPSNHPATYLYGYDASMQWDLNIFRLAEAAGMNLDLFFYLSDNATYGGNQKAPSSWQNYTLAETANALQQLTYSTTEYYIQKGVNISLYDIGNEIDLGIAGYSFDTKLYTPGINVLQDTTWDAQNIWNKEAYLLNASIAGVKQANPSAKIVLHISLSQYPSFVQAFFETMNQYHVPYDYGALSYYPWSDPHPYAGEPDPYQFLSQDIGTISSLGKGVIISEYSFPNSDPSINPAYGPTSWIQQVPGYPFTSQGQSAWIRSFITNMSEDSRVDMTFYFYPDAYDIDAQTALFYNDTTPMPALGDFVNLPSATTTTSSSTISPSSSPTFSSSSTQTSASSFSTTFTTVQSSSTPTSSGGGGIPEFPPGLSIMLLFTILIISAYLMITRSRFTKPRHV